MSLTAEQLAARDGKVTASFLPRLMAGKEADILNEWRRLVGNPAYVEEDLSDSWPVEFGSYIEPFALDWHQRKTGRALTRRGEVVFHPKRDYVCCTLDAFRPDDSTVIDCKAPGQWRRLDDVLTSYTAQLVCQRACVGAENAALLVVHGGSEPVEYPIEISQEYEAAVWQRVDEFWHCVETLVPPVALPAVAAPVKAEVVYDMGTSNEWCDHAVTWLENYEAAKKATSAEKAIKKLMPDDAAKCHGHGIVVTRDRAGRLSLRSAA